MRPGVDGEALGDHIQGFGGALTHQFVWPDVVQ